MMRARFLFTAALLLCASPCLGQQVEVRGRGDADTDAYLRGLVASGDYTLVARDTLIARDDTVRGRLLVVRGTLRLDGVVTGDLVIVDANVFVRPTARVLGSVINIAGGYYPSELATVAGGVHSEPNAPYTVREGGDDTWVILGTHQPSVLVRPGLFGFGAPTYDRVDGLTLTWGSGLLLPRMGRVEPIVRGRVDFRTQRRAITGGLELGLPRGATELVIGAERTTLTNERWIRGDLDNSLSFLLKGNDYRDYYEADRGYAELRRTFETGSRNTSGFLRAQVEDARSLRARRPWTLFGTPRPDNIVVDGRITSAIAGTQLQWTQRNHALRLRGSAEAAGRALKSDHTFAAYVLDADWAMAALANHTLRVQPHFQGPLPGTDSLPTQRWSFVGGGGTLYTFDIAEFRGDRVAFIETQYIIPTRTRLPFVGTPELELLHLAGMAWTLHERRSFEQNVGLRLRFSLFNVRVVTNPDRFTDDVEFSFGVNLPRSRYPWEEERP